MEKKNVGAMIIDLGVAGVTVAYMTMHVIERFPGLKSGIKTCLVEGKEFLHNNGKEIIENKKLAFKFSVEFEDK